MDEGNLDYRKTHGGTESEIRELERRVYDRKDRLTLLKHGIEIELN